MRLRPIWGECLQWFATIVRHLPGHAGYVARRWWAGRTWAHLGHGAVLGQGLLVTGEENIEIGNEFSCWRMCTIAACADGRISIGNNVSFNSNVYVNACSGGVVQIGHDVLVGPNVVLRASDHNFADVTRPMRLQGHRPGTIVIEDDVWLAANVTVVGGVRIGRGAVVAANAVVTSDVAPFMVVGGVPAREIGRRAADA